MVGGKRGAFCSYCFALETNYGTMVSMNFVDVIDSVGCRASATLGAFAHAVVLFAKQVGVNEVLVLKQLNIN